MTNTKAGTRAKARLTLTFNDLTPLQQEANPNTGQASFFIGAIDAGTIDENSLHKKCNRLLKIPLQSVIIGKGKGQRPNRRAQQWRQSQFTTGRR